ncbi:hypothetical protein [Actinoplanes sp. NPDC048796]|uniref:effector-associated constant component EACC1 n=1 Tax=unclassified Actinoplanes TaxID=2626549 RepID=UPI00340074EB
MADKQFTVEAVSNGWDPADERWQAEAGELYDELARNRLVVPGAPAPGERGLAETLIVALGSAGAFTAFRDIVTTWLKARGESPTQGTSVVIKRTGQDLQVEIPADKVDDPGTWDLVKRIIDG